jgi:two-component sensor histidine kinase
MSVSLPATPSPERPGAERLGLRQLRHHTKNALQGLIAQIDQVPELQETEAGQRLAHELQHRILLSARIADALFGFTGPPAALEARLRSLCENIVRLFGELDQDIRIQVTVRGSCPVDLHEVILRSMHEIVGNSVKHGLHGRTDGLISVRLETTGSSTILTVQDTGSSSGQLGEDDESLEIVRELIAEHDGTLRLHQDAIATTAILDFPRSQSATLFR